MKFINHFCAQKGKTRVEMKIEIRSARPEDSDICTSCGDEVPKMDTAIYLVSRANRHPICRDCLTAGPTGILERAAAHAAYLRELAESVEVFEFAVAALAVEGCAAALSEILANDWAMFEGTITAKLAALDAWLNEQM